MDNKTNVNSVNDIELIRRGMNPLTAGNLALQTQNEVQKSLDLENQATIQKNSFEKSYNFCLAEIKTRALNGYVVTEGEDIPPIALKQFEIDEDIRSFLHSSEFWESYIDNPVKIQFLTDYTDDMLLSLYHLATIHFENKQYSDCIKIYTFLCLMNPDIASFWIGMALSYEANDEIAAAMEAFEKAINAEPLKFTPYIGLIRCSEKLKNFENVKMHLTKAIEIREIEENAKGALEYVSSLEKVRG